MTGLRKSPACHVLGLGCAAGASMRSLREIAGEALRRAGLKAGQVGALATIEARCREPAMLALAESMALPILAFSAARLEEETPRLANPSSRVFALIGCHGVAEAAALAAAGAQARLVLPKIVQGRATAALASGSLSVAIPSGAVFVYGCPPTMASEENHHA